jgi:hypothetical protein
MSPGLASSRNDSRPETNAAHDACHRAGHRWRDCLWNPVDICCWWIIPLPHVTTVLEPISLLVGRAFTVWAFGQARSDLTASASVPKSCLKRRNDLV